MMQEGLKAAEGFARMWKELVGKLPILSQGTRRSEDKTLRAKMMKIISWKKMSKK